MLINQRIIWKDNLTLKDMSVELNDLTAGTYVIPFVTAEDKIYIGSDLPFNHRYFAVSVANDVASVASVEIWTGSAWESAVDVLDQTSSGGKTMKVSGILSWTPERNSAWGIEETTEDIPDLSTLKIYNMYWARLSFSGNHTAGSALSYVGHKFANDADLAGFYPSLNTSDVKGAFATGKTSWDDQHVLAAEEIVRHLRKKKEIRSSNQIVDWEQYNHAGVHKLAEIIYSSFGDDYEDHRKRAEISFNKAINLGVHQIDRDGDGRLDTRERMSNSGLFRR